MLHFVDKLLFNVDNPDFTEAYAGFAIVDKLLFIVETFWIEKIFNLRLKSPCLFRFNTELKSDLSKAVATSAKDFGPI